MNFWGKGIKAGITAMECRWFCILDLFRGDNSNRKQERATQNVYIILRNIIKLSKNLPGQCPGDQLISSLYINNLPDVIDGLVKIFADDT